MNQLYQPPNMAAANTRTPTPAPIPALAPVERPEELLLPSLEATRVGATPGVLVKVAGVTMVVAARVSTITEVMVAKPVTPSEVVGSVAVTYVVLVSYETEELEVVMATGAAEAVDEVSEEVEESSLEDIEDFDDGFVEDMVGDVVEEVVTGNDAGLDIVVLMGELVAGGEEDVVADKHIIRTRRG